MYNDYKNRALSGYRKQRNILSMRKTKMLGILRCVGRLRNIEHLVFDIDYVQV